MIEFGAGLITILTFTGIVILCIRFGDVVEWIFALLYLTGFCTLGVWIIKGIGFLVLKALAV